MDTSRRFDSKVGAELWLEAGRMTQHLFLARPGGMRGNA